MIEPLTTELSYYVHVIRVKCQLATALHATNTLHQTAIFAVIIPKNMANQAAQDNRVQQHSAQTDLSTPFSCSVCNFTSSSTKDIKIHIRRKHPDHPAITVNITGIVCLVSGCSFRSETTKGVKIHLFKSHKWSKGH